jgi:hypothetical protein
MFLRKSEKETGTRVEYEEEPSLDDYDREEEPGIEGEKPKEAYDKSERRR